MSREMLSRIVAAIILVFPLAALAGMIDQAKITRMQGLSPQQFYDQTLYLANANFMHRFSVCLILVFYTVAVEGVAFVLRRARTRSDSVSLEGKYL